MDKSIDKLVLRTFGRVQSKPLTKDKEIKEKVEVNFNKPLLRINIQAISMKAD